MVRSAATKIYANFTGGFVTEGNKLSYPENAAIDIDNLDINEDGSVQRRAGLDYDGTNTKAITSLSVPLAGSATVVRKWKAVNGNDKLNIAVVQVGKELDFYYIREDELLSTTPAAPTLTLTVTSRPSASTDTTIQKGDISVASGGGRLYVVGKYIDPFVLEFQEPAVQWETGSVTKTDLVLKVRDFGIAEEGETFTEGGTTFSIDGEKRQDFITAAHVYNISNQGWPSEEVSMGFIQEAEAKVMNGTGLDSGAADGFPTEETLSAVGFYPTTSDLFHTYQNGGGDTVTEQIAYSPWLLDNDYTGTGLSPRGRFIKEAFYLERKAYSLFNNKPSTLPWTSYLSYEDTVSSEFRPTTVAFYAGRVWYGGLEGLRYTNNLYFSQVISDDVNKAAKCYQEADPTAEEINELVATDGGLLGLEEVGRIFTLAPIGPSLVVIADNGVWAISGDGEVSSFRADSFSIRKVTDQGAISKGSVVFAKDIIYYWGETSIIAVLTGPQGGIVAQDISSQRIKNFYQQKTNFVKQSSFSGFDEGANRILWFYEDGLDNSFENLTGKAYNKVLYFDISLGAFGKYTLQIDNEILPVSGISAEVFNILTVTEPVTVDGEVVTAGGEDVTVSEEIFIPERSSVKLLTITGNATSGYSYRFSDFRDVSTFSDWDTSFSSYVEGGFDSLGDILSKAKKAPMVQIYFERTEDGYDLDAVNDELVYSSPSGCIVTYGWDWEESPFSNPFQAYRLLRNYIPENSLDDFNYDQTIISTRNRLRGRGTSLGLRFESEDFKDFRLVGYSVVYTNRSRV